MHPLIILQLTPRLKNFVKRHHSIPSSKFQALKHSIWDDSQKLYKTWFLTKDVNIFENCDTPSDRFTTHLLLKSPSSTSLHYSRQNFKLWTFSTAILLFLSGNILERSINLAKRFSITHASLDPRFFLDSRLQRSKTL